mgnify:CR=1 FL=1
MKGETQHFWKHQIAKSKKDDYAKSKRFRKCRPVGWITLATNPQTLKTSGAWFNATYWDRYFQVTPSFPNLILFKTIGMKKAPNLAPQNHKRIDIIFLIFIKK